MPLAIFAQSFPELKFKHLTVANGLPTKHIAITYKDSQNLLWIGSRDNGLIRYDGRNYKLYVQKPNNFTNFWGTDALQIIEDSVQNLWIGNGKCLNYYNRKTENIEKIYFKDYTKDGKLNECLGWNIPHYIDNKNRLWFYTTYHQKLLTYSINTKKFDVKVDEINYCNERSIFYPNKLYQEVQFIVSTQRQSGFRIIHFKNGEIHDFKDYFNKGNKSFPEANIERSVVIQNPENLWFNSTLGMIDFNSITEKYVIYNQYKGEKIGSIHWITALDDRYLLITTVSKGIFVFDTVLKQFIQNIRHLDSDPESIMSNSVEYISCDESKNIFVSFFGGGIDIATWPTTGFGQFISRQSTEQFKTNNHFKFIQEINATNFWCVNSENKILAWNPTKNELSEPNVLRKFNQKNAGNAIQQIYIDDSKQIFVVTDNGIYIKLPTENDFHAIHQANNINRMIQIGVNSYSFTKSNGVFLMKKSNQKWIVREATELNKIMYWRGVYGLNFDTQSKILYITCEWGQVFCQVKLINDSLKYIIHSDWSTSAGDSGGLYNQEHNDILSSTINGIVRYDIQKNKFDKPCKEPIADNEFSSLVQFDSQTYYALSNNSLVKISLPNWTFSKIEIPLTGTSKENLIFSSIYCGSDKFLYLVSNNGILRYNPNQKKEVVNSPQIFISSIETNGKEDTLLKAANALRQIELGPEVNNVDICLSNTNFANGNILSNLKYQIKGFDTSLEMIENNGRIHLNKLPSGEFTFAIIDAESNKILRNIKIIVYPYWYQTTLFKLVSFTFLVIISLILFMLRVNKIRYDAKLKSDYENKMIHLEMQNLRSQMNPHFIFNSLNSINSFIVQNKTHLASDYLTKFSRLIRLILDNSKNESIGLDKEVETLRLYLLMESIRFEKKFDFDIEIAENTDESTIKVPPMIIQPFVENAIWHGLLHKEEKGKVIIYIQQIENSLIITIEDNGIGREKAAELRSKNNTSRKSYGMEITKQRIQYLNANNAVKIIDLVDEKGNARGTKIELHIYS